MSISESHLAYKDCEDLYDRAIDDPKGVRAWIGTESDATFYRMRMHQCRKIARRRNAEIYKPGDPLYDACPWDALTVRLREDEEGSWWVYVEKTELAPGAIESLSTLED